MKYLIAILVLSLSLIHTAYNDAKLFLGETEGIVKDYTGLDGCGFIIELANGDRLEPAQVLDSNFVFYDGQKIVFTYTELKDVGSICMVGKIVRVENIREAGCNGLTTYSSKLPDDPFAVDSVQIVDDCLKLSVSYSGGCKSHIFQLTILPTMGPLNTLSLCHEANNDLCEAWITEKITFDLRELQSLGTHSVTFVLMLNFEGSDFSTTLQYNY
ncbi:MAG: hypothetical protein J7L04_07830 [Bacteroidales bacterium]|nr:hypothetical protein [Bacteroidales bacterium]